MSAPNSNEGERPRALGRLVMLVTALVVLLLPFGCRSRHDRDPRVVGVFGGLGMGPGDFSYPRAVAADPDGTVLIVDKSGRIQRFSSEGKYIDGWRMPETEAGKPVGLTVHPDRRVFVADTHYHRVVIFSPEGEQLTTFGSEGDGDGQFRMPTDVAFDSDGNIFVSEYGGNDRITRWSPALMFDRVVVSGEVAGLGLSRPSAVDFDAEQTLWIADSCNHRLLRISRDGKLLGVFGSMGSEAGQMRYPYDIAVAPGGRIMVCEYGGDRLQWFDQEGHAQGTWGGSGREPGQLHAPWGAAYGANGMIYVVDSLNSRIQILRP